MVTVAESWPLPARVQAHQLVSEFGAPNIEVSTSLAWQPASPWERICLHCNGLLEQTVPYEIPAERRRQLDFFGTSLVIDQVRNEVTAVSDSQSVNRLILNLMHDVLIGAKTAHEAVEKYRRSQHALAHNYPDPYVSELQFYTDTYQFDRQKSFPGQAKHEADLTYVRPRERHAYSR